MTDAQKDLIARLRRKGISNTASVGFHLAICDDAADEIERLQAENDALRNHASISFTTINVDEIYVPWSFSSVEEIRAMYHADEYDGPGGDDPVTDFEIYGVPMYFNNFDEVVEAFGLEEK